MGYFVYILYSAKLNRYYIGQTENLGLAYHNDPIESKKFTARGIPWDLKLSISCQSKEHALRLEKFIKRMKSTKFIESQIGSIQLQNDILKKVST